MRRGLSRARRSGASCGRGARVRALEIRGRVCIPQLTLVARERSQIPRLDKDTLRLVRVIIVRNGLHPNFHAVLGEHDVLLLHLILSSLC